MFYSIAIIYFLYIVVLPPTSPSDLRPIIFVRIFSAFTKNNSSLLVNVPFFGRVFEYRKYIRILLSDFLAARNSFSMTQFLYDKIGPFLAPKMVSLVSTYEPPYVDEYTGRSILLLKLENFRGITFLNIINKNVAMVQQKVNTLTTNLKPQKITILFSNKYGVIRHK